jgi:hypothetical protein
MMQLPESIKAKSEYDLTSVEEVTLENVLLGIEVDDNSDITDIIDAEEENDNEDVDEEDEDEEEFQSGLVIIFS